MLSLDPGPAHPQPQATLWATGDNTAMPSWATPSRATPSRAMPSRTSLGKDIELRCPVRVHILLSGAIFCVKVI